MVLVLDSLDSPALRLKMLDALGFASTNLSLYFVSMFVEDPTNSIQ